MFILCDKKTELFKVDDMDVAKFYANKFNLEIKTLIQDEPYTNTQNSV